MLGLNLVRSALATLATNITGLAATVADINRDLRQRAALDGPADVENVPALPMPIATPTAASGESEDANPPTSRNGRRKPVATS